MSQLLMLQGIQLTIVRNHFSKHMSLSPIQNISNIPMRCSLELCDTALKGKK